MQTKRLKFSVLIGVIMLSVSCGGSTYIPAGSQSLGVYQGTHSGVRTTGAVRVHLYQAPDGTKRFEGDFTGEMIQTDIFFRGTMTGNALEGEFSAIAGTITGELSADGSRMTGTYNVTWQAKKK